MKAVIMAGGRGTRFWPLSRKAQPKQFLRLIGEYTALQQTIQRLEPLLSSQDVFVVCGERHVNSVREQLPTVPADQIIAEPVGRNTAPCLGLAALHLRRLFPGETMAVLPSDHSVREKEEFHELLLAAESLAQSGRLVTFGILPTRPATGYGYLRRGEKIGSFRQRTAYRVAAFTEKPDLPKAQEFLSSGHYYWNSGMFVWQIETILAEIRSSLPDLYEALKRVDRCRHEPEKAAEIFRRISAISIDYGVMEQSRKVAVLPGKLGWDDLGNWKALENLRPGDEEGIRSNCRYISVDSGNSSIHATADKLVALVGVENLVIVETADALLVCNRDRTEDVREVVRKLQEKEWTDYQ